jgi:hypothetical protein
MDYEGFFKDSLEALCARDDIVSLPISNGAAAVFRAPFDHRIGTEVTTWDPIMTEVRVGKEPRCCFSFVRDSA